MGDDLVLENLFSEILADYFTTYGVNPFPINISIVDDMWDGYAKLRPDHAKKEPEMAEFQRTNNGTVVPPKKFEGTFTILLNKDYVIDSLQKNTADWIGTLVHEAVHVNDFIQFAKLVKATDYDIVLNREKYRMFHLWTEFNAKAKGYYFVRKYTFKNVQDEGQLQYIFETELPFQINNMFVAYHSTSDGDRQMYYVVHFIGRLYILQKLFPRYFTEEHIRELFVSNMWMYELYTFLTTHTELEDANRYFNDMKEILKQNFSGLD